MAWVYGGGDIERGDQKWLSSSQIRIGSSHVRCNYNYDAWPGDSPYELLGEPREVRLDWTKLAGFTKVRLPHVAALAE
jgi:hypothetical protein